MTKLEKVIYTARAHTMGGCDGGASCTDDGRLDVRLSVPGKPARLNVNMPGVDQQVAESLVETAHHLCPYSNATRGNIEVTLNVATGGTTQPMAAAQHV